MAKKIELYEIIAKRLQESETAEPNPTVSQLYNQGNAYELTAAKRRSNAREIVLSLDAAFVIFVLVLILLGTAYSLGVTNGEQKQRENFDTPLPAVPEVELGSLGASEVGEIPATAIKISPQLYTLRLTDDGDFSSLQAARNELLGNEVIRDGGGDVFVFQAGGKYVLTAGVFAESDERNLNRMREFFGQSSNYRDMSLERIADLGAPIL